MNLTDTTPATSTQRIPAAGFGVVVALWAVFAAGALLEPSRLGELWQDFREWPILGQLLGWVLLLPWLLATVVWAAPWVLWLRLLMVALIALFTLVAFSPKK